MGVRKPHNVDTLVLNVVDNSVKKEADASVNGMSWRVEATITRPGHYAQVAGGVPGVGIHADPVCFSDCDGKSWREYDGAREGANGWCVSTLYVPSMMLLMKSALSLLVLGHRRSGRVYACW